MASHFAHALVIGYGNPDRQDDGVAGHVLDQLSLRLGKPVHFSSDDLPQDTGGVELLLQLQLTPEIVDGFLVYNPIIFVDAHTGEDSQDVEVKELGTEYQSSPLTHHMTPETCMAILKTLYQKTPRGILVSIRGYEFRFVHGLSPQTAQSVDRAVEMILNIISEHSPPTR